MEKFKRVLRRMLFPGAAVTVISALAGAALLAYTFLIAGEENPVAYVAYVVSAYGLTVVCTGVVPKLINFKSLLRKNPKARRFMDDVPFRLNVSLHASLAINLLYAAVNGFSGIYYSSVWFATLAVYYFFLSLMRFTMVRYVHRHGFGENMEAELRRCRACGAMLIAMNIAMAGVVILVISQNRSFHYAGSLIYLMAMYTFYITVMAIINLVKYRRYKSPVMFAAKAVNMAAALVSMLSLETAMLSQFGGAAEDSEFFRRAMVASTGGIACIIVVAIGSYMVIRSTKRLEEMGKSDRAQRG